MTAAQWRINKTGNEMCYLSLGLMACSRTAFEITQREVIPKISEWKQLFFYVTNRLNVIYIAITFRQIKFMVYTKIL